MSEPAVSLGGPFVSERGLSHHGLTPDARVCHWCGGDGLHPFLPNRWRHILMMWLNVEEVVDSLGGRFPRETCEGVSIFWPYREWRITFDLIASRGIQMPYDLPAEDTLRCPRCIGWGVVRAPEGWQRPRKVRVSRPRYFQTASVT